MVSEPGNFELVAKLRSSVQTAFELYIQGQESQIRQ